jgi:hypothetical protein
MARKVEEDLLSSNSKSWDRVVESEEVLRKPVIRDTFREQQESRWAWEEIGGGKGRMVEVE